MVHEWVMMIDESQGAPDFVTVSIPTSTTTARQFQNGAKTYLVSILKGVVVI